MVFGNSPIISIAKNVFRFKAKPWWRAIPRLSLVAIRKGWEWNSRPRSGKIEERDTRLGKFPHKNGRLPYRRGIFPLVVFGNCCSPQEFILRACCQIPFLLQCPDFGCGFAEMSRQILRICLTGLLPNIHFGHFFPNTAATR